MGKKGLEEKSQCTCAKMFPLDLAIVKFCVFSFTYDARCVLVRRARCGGQRRARFIRQRREAARAPLPASGQGLVEANTCLGPLEVAPASSPPIPSLRSQVQMAPGPPAEDPRHLHAQLRGQT